MRRRDILLGLLAATGTSAVWAVSSDRVYRLAVCTQFGMAAFSGQFWQRRFSRLRQLGYLEGQNLIVDRYAADGHPERYAEVAREAVQQKPDVISVSFDHRLISQVANETSTIPIVALMGDPVAAGLVHNIARPEGNITGVALDAGIEMQGKHLDILRQAVPSASRVAYLSNRAEWEGAWGRAAIEAGRASGISIIGIPMERAAGEREYRQAFEAMVSQSVEALMVNGFAPNFDHQELIAELAVKYRFPWICWWPDLVEKGQALIAYAPNYVDLDERWGDEIDQILKGAKPADIPIYQPTKFVLAVNLKTARAMDLKIPSTLLGSADEVIE